MLCDQLRQPYGIEKSIVFSLKIDRRQSYGCRKANVKQALIIKSFKIKLKNKINKTKCHTNGKKQNFKIRKKPFRF